MAYQANFGFRLPSGEPCGPREWLNNWEPRYPEAQYDEKYYDHLIQQSGNLASEDFILLGRWKDSAWTERKWRANVAMVAFPAWMDAARELPGFDLGKASVEEFLNTWSEHLYPDASSKSVDGQKRFGLSRTTALLHFMSAGKFPICDSRVRTAIRRLTNRRAPDEVKWYLASYIPLFEDLAGQCCTSPRSLDKALFAYGRK